jgi:hypothetical protein
MPRLSATGSPDYVTIVAGLPRSGTSMMMQMLRAGGMALATDGRRAADEDNPRGYFELEAVKELPAVASASWLGGLCGQAVKMVHALLYHLPEGIPCRLILMERRLEEVVMSQRIMLERMGKPVTVGDAEMAGIYAREMDRLRRWLEGRPELQRAARPPARLGVVDQPIPRRPSRPGAHGGGSRRPPVPLPSRRRPQDSRTLRGRMTRRAPQAVAWRSRAAPSASASIVAPGSRQTVRTRRVGPSTTASIRPIK